MSETVRTVEDAKIIRRQLLWIAAVIVVAAAVWGVCWWGQETGWGNPDRAVANLMDLGEKDFVSGHMEDAVAEYRAVVQRYPGHPRAVQAMTQLASVLQQLGRYQDALQVLQKLYASLQAHQGRADLKAYTLLQIGDVRRSLGDYAGALDAYTTVRRTQPKTDWAGEAQSGIGAVYQAQGLYARARSAYGALIREIPGGFLAAEAQTSIGQCYEAQKRYRDALRAYEVVLRKYPPAVWDTAQSRVDALKRQLEGSDGES